MRFIDSIKGLSDVFETDIPKNSIVLITGGEGTLKSGFTFSLLSNYLEGADEYGIYLTLEQSKESHMRNVQNMGIHTSERLIISDLSDYRMQFEEFSGNLLNMIETNIIMYKKKMGDKFTCIGFDSLGALYSLLNIEQNELRKQMYRFFEALRRENITAFIILEKPDITGADQTTSGVEGYIADGVIELGMHLKDNTVNRYMRVRKMRAAKHSMGPWLLKVSEDGLTIHRGIIF